MFLAVDILGSLSDIRKSYRSQMGKPLPLDSVHKILDTDSLEIKMYSGKDLVQSMKSGMVVENLRLDGDDVYCNSSGVYDFMGLINLYKTDFGYFDRCKLSLFPYTDFSRSRDGVVLGIGNIFLYLSVDHSNGGSVLKISCPFRYDRFLFYSDSYFSLLLSKLMNSDEKDLYDFSKYGDESYRLEVSYITVFDSYYVVELIYSGGICYKDHVRISLYLSKDGVFVDSLIFHQDDVEIEQLYPIKDKAFHGKLMILKGGS